MEYSCQRGIVIVSLSQKNKINFVTPKPLGAATSIYNNNGYGSDRTDIVPFLIIRSSQYRDVLVSPHTVKTLSRMPEPRQGHGVGIFDDSVLSVSGAKIRSYDGNLSCTTVIKKKKMESAYTTSIHEGKYIATDMRRQNYCDMWPRERGQ